MKRISYLTIVIFFLNISFNIGQSEKQETLRKHFPISKITIEPAIGVNPMPMSDVVLSNLIQWNIKKHFNLVSRSAISFNTAFARDFNYVKTDYSYTLSQTIGIGTSFYLKRSSHTFSLMAGIKYDATKETLHNPEFETVSVSSSTLSPDFGLMYNFKKGMKKYFFSFRTYIPLYPFPFKTLDTWSLDGNLANTSLEFGIGIRLK